MVAVLFTILMHFFLINLVIAIVSDHYDRVQLTQKSSTLKQKCQMLLDLGLLLSFFNKLASSLCAPFVKVKWCRKYGSEKRVAGR